MEPTEGTPKRYDRGITGDRIPISSMDLTGLTIEDTISIAVKHAQNNPEHGINCICMDNLTRHVRGVVQAQTDAQTPADRARIRRRVAYVLAAAMDRLDG